MIDKFMRIRSVMEATGKSRSAIYADIKAGAFPKPIPIGARAVAWPASFITAWIKEKMEPIKPKKASVWDSLNDYVPKQGFDIRAEDI